jgi:hypothetical protein
MKPESPAIMCSTFDALVWQNWQRPSDTKCWANSAYLQVAGRGERGPALRVSALHARESRLAAMSAAVPSNTNVSRGQVTTREAILTGWLLCGVLDITAACLQAWIQAGRAPADVLRGVASALWGRAAMTGGPDMAAIGLAMHFTVALTATMVFYGLSRRFPVLRTAPLWIIGPLYGVVVFCAMNYGTLPALSGLRSLYLHTAPQWPGSMRWAQLAIHLVCVGLPIAWGVRRAP